MGVMATLCHVVTGVLLGGCYGVLNGCLVDQVFILFYSLLLFIIIIYGPPEAVRFAVILHWLDVISLE